jgi:hypothetical protein
VKKAAALKKAAQKLCFAGPGEVKPARLKLTNFFATFGSQKIALLLCLPTQVPSL